MNKTYRTRVALCLFSFSVLTGCSMNTSLLSIQDKFTYPNGDYESLGRATAKRSYTRLFSAPVMTREVFRDLEQQALASQSGADVMVDYVISSNVIAIPYLYLPAISITTFELEGTALRFRELGGQQFRNPPPAGAH
jgi:hypothetical protein